MPREEVRAEADSGEDEAPLVDGPVHRPLIRAQLPRVEGQKEVRPAPDFTMRHTPSRGGGNGHGGFRGDRDRMRMRGGGNGTGNGNSSWPRERHPIRQRFTLPGKPRAGRRASADGSRRWPAIGLPWQRQRQRKWERQQEGTRLPRVGNSRPRTFSSRRYSSRPFTQNFPLPAFSC